jgi:phosphoadenosine phosphosulfate reductase
VGASNVFTETSRLLQDKARQSPSVLVSFSGGKDSLACLDLCSRAFQHVVAFYMYLVPGLRHIEERMAWARDRYGVEVLYYPHWVFFKCLCAGIYCPNHHSFDDLPPVTLADIYQMVRQETGIRYIAHGGKDADGLWRRRMFANTKGKKWEGMLYPIKGWTKYDVLAYLQSRGIPVPEESQAATRAGVDLSTPSLLWLHDKHPDDFRRLCRWFPYAEAVVKRRDWYGVA